MLKNIAYLSIACGLLIALYQIQAIAAEPESSVPETQTSEAAKQEAITLGEQGHIAGYLQLDVGSKKIDAALIQERLGKNYGGVLLLGDIDEGIDEKGVIHALRETLPDFGWSVMTVALDYPYKPNILLSEKSSEKIEVNIAPEDAQQPAPETTENTTKAENGEQASSTPSPDTGKKADKASDKIDNLTRIQSAITYFQQQAVPRIILIGHGNGVLEAINSLKADSGVAAALISIGLNDDGSAFSSLLETTPILDVLSSRDGMQQIQARKAAMKRQNKNYAQRVLVMDLDDAGLQLTSTVAGWLNKEFVEEDAN